MTLKTGVMAAGNSVCIYSDKLHFEIYYNRLKVIKNVHSI